MSEDWKRVARADLNQLRVARSLAYAARRESNEERARLKKHRDIAAENLKKLKAWGGNPRDPNGYRRDLARHQAAYEDASRGVEEFETALAEVLPSAEAGPPFEELEAAAKALGIFSNR